MQTLEIIFYGLALFVAVPNPTDPQHYYRVMLPDGRRPAAISKASHAHSATIWVRPRTQLAKGDWQPPTQASPNGAPSNDWVVAAPCTLDIAGIKKTPLDDSGMVNELQSVKALDPAFTIDFSKQALVDLVVNTGKLKAFKYGHMIVVSLTVESDGDPITISCGHQLKLTPQTDQVVIANIPSDGVGTRDDFNLYRLLASKSKTLLCPPPRIVNLEEHGPEDPSTILSSSEDNVQCAAARMPAVPTPALLTPELACSPGTYP